LGIYEGTEKALDLGHLIKNKVATRYISYDLLQPYFFIEIGF